MGCIQYYKNHIVVIFLLGIIQFSAFAGEPAGSFIEKTLIFHRNFDPTAETRSPDITGNVVYNYRIPSLVVTGDGTILAFADKRKAPKDYSGRGVVRKWGVRDWGHETDISLMRSTDKGRDWSKSEVIATREETDIHGGPALVDYQTGRIYKFMRFYPAWDYKTSKEYAFTVPLEQMREEGYGDYYVYSDDDGTTWSGPAPIYLPYPDGAVGCGLGNSIHGIQLESVRLVIQGKYTMPSEGERRVRHRVLFYSDDHGNTWQHGADIAVDRSMSTQEFPLVEYKPNHIYMNFRTTAGYRVEMRSLDGGLSVTEPSRAEDLPGPKCHAGMTHYKTEDNTLLLFSAPDNNYGNGTGSVEARHDLTVFLSRDGGETWPEKRLVCDGISAYSDIATLPDGSIVCLYESGKKGLYEYLEFARLSLELLTEKTE